MYVFYDLFLRKALLETWIDAPFALLDQLTFRVLAAAIVSFLFVLLLGKRTIAWLRMKKIGDAGLTDAAALESVATEKKHVPTMGGILIVGSIVFSTLLLSDFRINYVVLALVTLLWMAALGGVDDWLKLTAATRATGSRQGLFAWEKLIGQFGGAVLVAFFAYRYGMLPDAPLESLASSATSAAEAATKSMSHVLNIPFQKTYIAENTRGISYIVNPSLIYLSLPVFVIIGMLVIAGTSNAVNIADGMDGLAAGTSAAVAIGVTILALIAGQKAWAEWLLVPYVAQSAELAVMAGAMAGACLGFLWFNCSPASVFMGDTGALALGGLIGFIAMVVRQEFVILFMCGIFLIEIGSVVLQVSYFRLTGGKRIFKVAPYHHHLHLLGWREQQVVARFWIITVLLVAAGLVSIKIR